MERGRIRSVLESLLLAADKPLTVARMVEVIAAEDPSATADEVRAAWVELRTDWDDAARRLGRGVQVDELGGGFQLRTTPENAAFVRRLLAARPARMSRPTLETLAIIAYRQPVTKPEVEEIRGVDSGAVLKALLDRRLIKILGKKEELGRPLLYGTTPEFLQLFGLKALAALPTLREYQELSEEHKKQVDDLDAAAVQPGAPTLPLFEPAVNLMEARSDDAALVELDRALDRVESVSRSKAET